MTGRLAAQRNAQIFQPSLGEFTMIMSTKQPRFHSPIQVATTTTVECSAPIAPDVPQESAPQDARRTRLEPVITDWIETSATLTISALMTLLWASLLYPL
jgi:hypothetical protein